MENRLLALNPASRNPPGKGAALAGLVSECRLRSRRPRNHCFIALDVLRLRTTPAPAVRLDGSGKVFCHP